MAFTSSFASLLDEALEAWQYTRAGVISEIKNLPDVSLTYRPATNSRTPAEIAMHIVESGLMMAGELSRPDGNFRRKPFPQFMKEYTKGLKPATTKTQLIQLLTRTREDGEKKIRAAGELHFLQYITRFDGQPGTRLAWMNHGIAHEEYHRGQIALYARLVGRVPALTQLIYGKKQVVGLLPPAAESVKVTSPPFITAGAHPPTKEKTMSLKDPNIVSKSHPKALGGKDIAARVSARKGNSL